MDQETANLLFDKGAILLFLNAPRNLEFGIDFNAWTVGPLFKGIKLIPPGPHFVYFNSTSEEGITGIRTGFFKYFAGGEIVIKEWDPEIEDLKKDSELDHDQLERYKINIREFDRGLGAFPLDPPTNWHRWKSLISHVTPEVLSKVLPNNGIVSSLPAHDIQNVKNEERDWQHTIDPDKEEGIEFTPVLLMRSFPPGSNPEEITKWSLDKSWLLSNLVREKFKSVKTLLAELQLSFVLLLLAQNFSGFQQWKKVVQLICLSKAAIEDEAGYGVVGLFENFLDVIYTHLAECPEDFFYDILSADNFLAQMLKVLWLSLPTSNTKLRTKFEKLRIFIKARFNWSLGNDMNEGEEEEEEEGEFAPVIVDL